MEAREVTEHRGGSVRDVIVFLISCIVPQQGVWWNQNEVCHDRIMYYYV